jgi:hypothetical protein
MLVVQSKVIPLLLMLGCKERGLLLHNSLQTLLLQMSSGCIRMDRYPCGLIKQSGGLGSIGRLGTSHQAGEVMDTGAGELGWVARRRLRKLRMVLGACLRDGTLANTSVRVYLGYRKAFIQERKDVGNFFIRERSHGVKLEWGG